MYMWLTVIHMFNRCFNKLTSYHTSTLIYYVWYHLQAFRESIDPGASELLQKLADAKTDEDKEAVKSVVVSV